jgi:hypothetical protein
MDTENEIPESIGLSPVMAFLTWGGAHTVVTRIKPNGEGRSGFQWVCLGCQMSSETAVTLLGLPAARIGANEHANSCRSIQLDTL